MAYREMMRRKLLEEIYDKMSKEEKQMFMLLVMQDRSHTEIMEALQRQDIQINRLAEKAEKQSWLTDFSSDILANFTTDGLIWLVRRLFRR